MVSAGFVDDSLQATITVKAKSESGKHRDYAIALFDVDVTNQAAKVSSNSRQTCL